MIAEIIICGAYALFCVVGLISFIRWYRKEFHTKIEVMHYNVSEEEIKQFDYMKLVWFTSLTLGHFGDDKVHNLCRNEWKRRGQFEEYAKIVYGHCFANK